MGFIYVEKVLFFMVVSGFVVEVGDWDGNGVFDFFVGGWIVLG